jgi:carboxyl-terminal processing protease
MSHAVGWVFAIGVRARATTAKWLPALALGMLALALIGGCSRGGGGSPQGDKAAAQRAAASEGRQPQSRQARSPSEPTLLTGSDIGVAYRFVLDSYVERTDHEALIDAARGALSEGLSHSGALPIDSAPLDLLPLTTGSAERDWSAFSAAFDGVTQRHPEWSLETRLDYLAVRKMMESLGDNHSNFLTPEETRRRAESTYSGIGVRIARPDPNQAPVVIEVFQSSPAAIAGVRVGDRIVAVGDRDVRESALDEVADHIKGPQGSEVVLHLERTAAGGPIAVHAFRRTIDTPQADGQLLEGKVGYVKIRSFGETVAERVGRLLVEQNQGGAEGWVIDLRGNPGGNLQAVARVAGYFMENRPIGISVDRSGQREAIFAEQRPFSVKAPLVVLVDSDTGSGSEILAASFKEYQLASLVGQKTAGSVGIANARQLSDGSTVQLTVRRLLTPSGAQLDRLGVQPDEKVALSAQDLEQGQDPQRDLAVQLLRQRLPGA